MSLVPLRAYPGDSEVHGDTCMDAGTGGCSNMQFRHDYAATGDTCTDSGAGGYSNN
jgi:hypothetical protein